MKTFYKTQSKLIQDIYIQCELSVCHNNINNPILINKNQLGFIEAGH